MTPTERPVVAFPSVAPIHQPNVHRVLLVDDDHAVRAMMNATLERKGFQVVAVATVTEALKLIVTESFDHMLRGHIGQESDHVSLA
jgi:DNA-binding NtrC family response regulator